MAPEGWMCPLLGVDPDAFNHDTEEFSAIAATLIRHNAISEALSTRPESFEPLFVRSWDGEVDARPWCMGFYAVMKLRLLAWSQLLSPDRIEHYLLLPILFHCVDDAGRPAMPLATPRCASNAWRDIPATFDDTYYEGAVLVVDGGRTGARQRARGSAALSRIAAFERWRPGRP
jgi:yecA family protein